MTDQSKDSKVSLVVILTLLAALITAVMPFTAYINGRNNLALEKEKLSVQSGLDYLDRVLDSSKDPAYRSGALDLLIRTTAVDDPVHGWAVEQRKDLDTVLALKPQLDAVTANQKAVAAALDKERSGTEHPDTGNPAAPPSQKEKVLRQTITDLNTKRLNILSAVNAAELRTVIKPDAQTEAAIAEFRARPGVQEFLAKCAQDGGRFNYRVAAGKVHQLDCQFVNGSGQVPRIFTETSEHP
jgi:hypothetical protein